MEYRTHILAIVLTYAVLLTLAFMDGFVYGNEPSQTMFVAVSVIIIGSLVTTTVFYHYRRVPTAKQEDDLE